MSIVIPILIGVLYVTAVSVIREPHRLRFNAIMVAGAGAAYLSSGAFGPWEVAFTAAMTYCAYRGLTSYRWIGVAWLLRRAPNILLIPGTASLDHLRENLRAAELKLSDGVLARLEDIGEKNVQ